MSKAKSIVLTTLLAVAVFVATFFAAISFPVKHNVKRLNSIASNIHLGADFSGYVYTTIYPEGVKSSEYYENLKKEKKEDYEEYGSFYVEKSSDNYEDISELKEKVANDAKAINSRLGQKGYSSYYVSVEDDLSIKIGVPSNFTYASYKGNDVETRSQDYSVARSAVSSVIASGPLTLRVIAGAGENEVLRRGKDNWTGKAMVNGSDTYSITYGYSDDMSKYIKKSVARKVGATATITFKFTDEGQKMFKDISSKVASLENPVLYFFVGETALVNMECTEEVDLKKITLRSTDLAEAQNSATTINSVINGEEMVLDYQSDFQFAVSTAAYGENAALLVFIACIIVLVGLTALHIIKYRKLGIVASIASLMFMLVEVYALCLLKIQLTVAVLITCFAALLLFELSNVTLFSEVKRLTESGRTMQASVKEAYKKLIMTITDLHIVMVIIAIILAAVCVGEVAACGLISVICVAASYVLYWFTRFMWFVASAQSKDKFRFAGLKRVVYDYE